MTFREVAIKNFKSHIKKYSMCFICSSFSIMILFMYSTLLFNGSIISTDKESNGMDLLMYISMFVVIVFSIFFINYTNNAFLNSRYKEFGVMMTLGMNRRNIIKVIFVENMIIIISSLVIGIISGALFSRLFQMVIVDILGLKGIDYSLNYKSFVLTISVFLFIFLTQLLITSITTKKFTIEELIKKERVNQGKLKTKILPGIIGIIVLISSIVWILIIGNDENLRGNIELGVGVIIVMFIGVYIVISSLGMSILALVKSMPKVYSRNIIEVTNLNRKFNSQKKVIFVLTLLSTFTIFAIAPCLALLNETAVVVDLNRNDLEIAEVFGLNKVNENLIEEIANRHNIEIKNKVKFEFMVLNFETDNGGVDFTSKKPILSESQYNFLSDKKLNISEGEAIKLTTSWLPDNDNIQEGDILYLENISEKAAFKVSSALRDQWIANDRVFPTKSGVVLNDNDYIKLKESTDSSAIGICYQWQLSEWRNKEDFIVDINESLINDPSYGSEEYRALSNKYLFISKPILYNEMRQGYKFFVFTNTIMGILFFIASATVLFFNQYMELEESKRRFDKLYKIGVLKKEVNKIISKELLVTFFTPVFIGSIISAVLMNFVANIMGGNDMISQFMSSSYKVIGVYLIFQVIFYLFTRENYVRKINN
ncbi:FtsX-like permease family protein [Clostridium paraputrificum]|uniref:FtsX-like permease family protein n=1 Tax=Clostridium paraputrificum TaxID=29363 RepID=UPI003D33DD5A